MIPSSFSAFSVNSLAHVNLGWSSNFLWNGKISGRMEDIMKFEVEEFFHSDISKLSFDISISFSQES